MERVDWICVNIGFPHGLIDGMEIILSASIAVAVAFTVLVKSPYFSGQSFLKYRVGYDLGQTHALNVCAADLFRWNDFYRLVYGHLMKSSSTSAKMSL